jgi:dienelactone hydrolase
MNLAKNLIVTFIYEGRGFGRSEGTREKQTDSLVDLRGALNFLEAELGESFRWTGVLGHSIGGAAALKLATENPKIGAVMCYGTLPSYKLCSADDRVRKVAEHHWVNSQQKSSFDQYLAQYDPINCLEFADQVNVPVLLSGGGADNEYFRWDEQLRLAQSMLKAPSIEIRSFKEWHHSLEMSAPGFNIACASIAAWFRAIWEQHRKL